MGLNQTIMNTLTFFPFLVTYTQIAPFIIRVVLGLTLAYFAFRKIQGCGQSSGSNSLMYGIIEMIIALFLVIGLFTQVAATLNAVILVIKLGVKGSERKLLSDGVKYSILLLSMAVALMFMTPGLWAIDWLF